MKRLILAALALFATIAATVALPTPTVTAAVSQFAAAQPETAAANVATCSYQLEFEKELEFQTIVIPKGVHKVKVETPIWLVVQYNSNSASLVVNGSKGVKGHLGPYFVYSDFPVINYPDAISSDERILASFWPVNNEKIDSSLYPIVASIDFC